MDICPKCGVKSEGGHLCAGCEGVLHPERKEKLVKISACSECRRIHSRGIWREIHLADAIRDGVRHSLKGKNIRKMNLSIDGINFGPGLVHELEGDAEGPVAGLGAREGLEHQPHGRAQFRGLRGAEGGEGRVARPCS